MSHDKILRARANVTLGTVVNRIVRTFERATYADIEAGARWYSEAQSFAREFERSSTYSLEECAVVIAHLSPRTTWSRNILAARDVLVNDVRPTYALGGNVDRAQAVLEAGWENPVDSLKGPKTNRFARNILGDTEAVTVDVWAARVAGITELELGRVGVYDAIEHAYRLAARRLGVDPSTAQAVTWIVQRGGRSN